jgi:hypothetical protein
MSTLNCGRYWDRTSVAHHLASLGTGQLSRLKALILLGIPRFVSRSIACQEWTQGDTDVVCYWHESGTKGGGTPVQAWYSSYRSWLGDWYPPRWCYAVPITCVVTGATLWIYSAAAHRPGFGGATVPLLAAFAGTSAMLIFFKRATYNRYEAVSDGDSAI